MAQPSSVWDCYQYDGKDRELCERMNALEKRLEERQRNHEYEMRKAQIDTEFQARETVEAAIDMGKIAQERY
jgi:hypothetical protein